MNSVHPMLTNILSLADPQTWQRSVHLAEEALSNWAKPNDLSRIYFVGHGSSLFNSLVGEQIVEHVAGIPCKAVPAFSFSRYEEPSLLGPHTLVIGISTTGGTQSVCEALARARQAGSSTLAITSHPDTPITQGADAVILTGGEDDQISVKTKSYVQALISLSVLALHLSENTQQRAYWVEQISLAARGAHHFLENQRKLIQGVAEKYAGAPKVFVLGTGPNLGTAEEASLKVIEMAKMYSECQELEDFMHGRLREVDSNSPLFFIAPQGAASSKVLDFLTVTDMVHAPSIVLTDKITPGIRRLATHVIEMPVSLDEYATPLLYILPLHLFGYEMAVRRGYDPNARRYNIVPQNVRYQEEQ